MKTKEETKPRAFRLPVKLDNILVEKSKNLGFLTPSEYLRSLIRKEIQGDVN
jgi:predicted DNA-binding protein